MSRNELRRLTPVDSAAEELLGGRSPLRADEESTDFGTASENDSKTALFVCGLSDVA